MKWLKTILLLIGCIFFISWKFCGSWCKLDRVAQFPSMNLYMHDHIVIDTASYAYDWESIRTGDPWLMYANGQYYLYYWGHGDSALAISFATSADLINWTKKDTIPHFEVAGYECKPSIVLDGATYYMYYERHGTTKRIHLATTDDLDSAWADHGGNPVLICGDEPNGDSTISVMAPSIYKENATFYLIYTGQNEAPDYRWRIYYATSNDGQNFTKQGLLLDVSSSGWDAGWIAAGNIIKVGQYYIMIYTGCDQKPVAKQQEPNPDGFGLAHSTDLVNWTKFYNNPIIVTSDFIEGTRILWRTHLAKIDSDYYIFFNFNETGKPEKIMVIKLKHIISWIY